MKTVLIALAVLLTGCSAAYTGSTQSTTQYIRDTNGQTVARIRDGAVYNTQGIRTHRIDSSGNIYSTQGPTAGQRVGRIK